MKYSAMFLCQIWVVVLLFTFIHAKVYTPAKRYRNRESDVVNLEANFPEDGSLVPRWDATEAGQQDEPGDKGRDKFVSANIDGNSILWKVLNNNMESLREVLKNNDAHKVTRRRFQQSSVLPPWQEFCKMLNMAECSRFKRSLDGRRPF